MERRGDDWGLHYHRAGIRGTLTTGLKCGWGKVFKGKERTKGASQKDNSEISVLG